MKIGIQTWGSDGDIRPFLAFAGGLSSAGHNVTLAFTSIDNKNYSALAQAMNIKLIKVYKDIDCNIDIIGEELKTQNIMNQFTIILETFFDPFLEDMYKASIKLCAENDLVIGHSIIHTLSTAAEKYNRPRVAVALCPIVVESKYSPPLGLPNLGKGINPLLWKIAGIAAEKKGFTTANQIRVREGMSPIRNIYRDLFASKDLTILATSQSLCPGQPDWGDNVQVCGFFNIPVAAENWEMPEDLSVFLNDGTPPVYLTFGSLTPFMLEANTRLFIEAARLSGQRAIIQSDWNNCSGFSHDPTIYRITKAPHHNIFPHCSVIVHHGGAGTSQSSLRSGCPSVVVEHAGDQIYWGKQLQRVGVAGKVLHTKSITAEKLAKAIDAVLHSPSMRIKAQEMGKAMRKENGVKTAVQLIEDRFG
jgi:UDP:flavonoid glycosyltransferase YjiC (YdhE family)